MKESTTIEADIEVSTRPCRFKPRFPEEHFYAEAAGGPSQEASTEDRRFIDGLRLRDSG